MSPSVYVASKSARGGMWQEYRSAWADLGLQVASTWINEWQAGASSSMADLWLRCISEAASADFLVLYAHRDETLKGALIEVGAALAAGRPVYVCPGSEWSGEAGRIGSWANHPLVTFASDPDDAIEDWRANHLQTEWPGLGR